MSDWSNSVQNAFPIVSSDILDLSFIKLLLIASYHRIFLFVHFIISLSSVREVHDEAQRKLEPSSSSSFVESNAHSQSPLPFVRSSSTLTSTMFNTQTNEEGSVDADQNVDWRDRMPRASSSESSASFSPASPSALLSSTSSSSAAPFMFRATSASIRQRRVLDRRRSTNSVSSPVAADGGVNTNTNAESNANPDANGVGVFRRVLRCSAL
jgi:hypothetical protein